MQGTRREVIPEHTFGMAALCQTLLAPEVATPTTPRAPYSLDLVSFELWETFNFAFFFFRLSHRAQQFRFIKQGLTLVATCGPCFTFFP